jgi:nucleoside-diphosphate-sugar epimerase
LEANLFRTREPRIVLVVGGAGYVGSILVRKLLAIGRRVRVLDNLVYGSGAIADVLDHPNLQLCVGDCRNARDAAAAAKGAKAIIHLAAIVGDAACDQDRSGAVEVNYAATSVLIDAALKAGTERLIFASSCSAYGSSDGVMDEASAVQPISLYAETKVQSELALLAAAGPGFHPTVLRFATVFGNSYRPRFDLIVNLLTAKAYNEGTITIFNGGQWRPFIHVQDVVEGILRGLEAPISVVSGQIYNLGDSRLNYTLSDIGAAICAVFPETQVAHIENADRRNYRVSFEKIKDQLGFACSLRVEDGIRELKRVFDGGAISDYRDVQYHNQRFLERAGNYTRESTVTV